MTDVINITELDSYCIIVTLFDFTSKRGLPIMYSKVAAGFGAVSCKGGNSATSSFLRNS